jgi:DNA-binding CsgD family transcriptional regulator
MRAPEDAGVDPAVHLLVRQLVARLVEGRPPMPPGSGAVEQLVDIEVDGVRCRCVRAAPARATPAALSPREREIARMVAKGRTNQAIADVLGISAWTVSTHLRRIFTKLGVNSRAAMVAGVLDNERWPADEPPDRAGVSQVRVTPACATHVSGSPERATHVPASQEDATHVSVSP